MDLDKTTCLAIIGDIDTGKTNLAFHHMNKYKGKRKKYLLGYPKSKVGYGRISNFQDIFSLKDSIIFADELHKYVKVYDRKANVQLMELISLFKHKRNTLIFSTQLSQFITRGVEAFIDAWNLTAIRDLNSLKNGSKPKRIIQNMSVPQCTQFSLSLEVGEYLEFSEKNSIEQNGIHKFEFQNIKKDWE
jgi:hypothetical protein